MLLLPMPRFLIDGTLGSSIGDWALARRHVLGEVWKVLAWLTIGVQKQRRSFEHSLQGTKIQCSGLYIIPVKVSGIS